MIAKNEEKVIARCIESYRTAVNEIIVVDTGSTDQTVAIAKNLGAKVFYFNWIDDFAAAKNYAISKAKGDWIIFLDADEYFGENMGGNVRAVLQGLDPIFNSIACKMLNIDQVTGKVFDVMTQVRIFKNNKHIRYILPIHEMLQHKLPGKKIHAFMADAKDIVIYHTGYSCDNRKEKAERNLEVLLRELPQAPMKPGYYQYIADCYFGLEEWEKVIEYTNLFIESKTELSGHNIRPYHNLIDAMLKLDHPSKEVMAVINEAIGKFPYHPLFHFSKGNLLYESQKYDTAFQEYQETLQLHKNYDSLEFNPLPANLWLVYNRLGAISEHRNNCEAAIEYYLESLKLDNNNALCFDRLMMLIRTMAVKDIILCINTLYDLDNEADLDFLADCLVKHAVPQVMAYYISLREKKYPKQDVAVLQMLVANGYYDKAFHALLDYYRQDGDDRLAATAAAVALLSGNEYYVAECVAVLPPVFIKIIKAYCGEERDLLDAGIAAYVQIAQLIILWGTPSALERFVALLVFFPDRVQAAVVTGSRFIQDSYYQQGLCLYDWALEQAMSVNAVISPALYYNRGYCLQRLNEPAAALEAFISAYKLGYHANDIFEFLRWNIQNENDKNRVATVLGEDWKYVDHQI
ncbi:tetratricopeptide repeat-containing glycosyltransferase family 2 protein [Sporomusa termitida]|nr:glycosyltransferase family 2 protein [Sporomusa termitida]